ncbi:MAG: hypothetical protein HZA08_00015 [Nitrospirae bacterium]|nr:hypothetical protein [Nitrospirota bacterium]
MRKITLSSIIAVLFVVMTMSVGYAGSKIDLQSTLLEPKFKDMSKELGLLISYAPLSPAEPLGILGFDAGVEVTAAKIDSSNWKGVINNPPDYLILPKLHVQKGLPLGIDVGLEYATVPNSNISLYGGELKWAVLRGTIVSPAVAIRGSYTALSGVKELDASTYGLDASISKGFLFITPYAGVGQVWINTSENSSAVSFKDVSTSATKIFLGAKVKLLLVNLVVQADFSDVNMYSARVNVGF